MAKTQRLWRLMSAIGYLVKEIKDEVVELVKELKDLTNPPEGKRRIELACPRARTDMTPCIARDGRLAVTDDGKCVGCGINASEVNP